MIDKSKRIYIAYGCNTDTKGMRFRCKDCVHIGEGYIPDYKIVFKGCASIEKSEGDKVPVVLYYISPNDEKYLDMMEGFPHYYYKKTVKVITREGEEVEGMVYIMTNKYSYSSPSKGYYYGIYEAYEKFGFDTTELEKALQFAQNYNKEDSYYNSDWELV